MYLSTKLHGIISYRTLSLCNPYILFSSGGMVSLKKVLFHQFVDVFSFSFNRMRRERPLHLCATYVEVTAVQEVKLSTYCAVRSCCSKGDL